MRLRHTHIKKAHRTLKQDKDDVLACADNLDRFKNDVVFSQLGKKSNLIEGFN